MVFIANELAALRHLAEGVVQSGHNEHPEERPHQHPAHGGSPNRTVANGARAGCPHERNQTGNKGERCHQNRSEAHLRSFNGSGQNRESLLVLLHGKFHNQHGIFAQQAHEHDHTNLRIDVVRQAHRFEQHERTQNAQGQR